VTHIGLEGADTGAFDRRIVRIAATITKDWQRIDDAWEGVRRRRRDVHLRRDVGLDEQEFLCEALALARALNLLRTFAAELIKNRLTPTGPNLPVPCLGPRLIVDAGPSLS